MSHGPPKLAPLLLIHSRNLHCGCQPPPARFSEVGTPQAYKEGREQRRVCEDAATQRSTMVNAVGPLSCWIKPRAHLAGPNERARNERPLACLHSLPENIGVCKPACKAVRRARVAAGSSPAGGWGGHPSVPRGVNLAAQLPPFPASCFRRVPDRESVQTCVLGANRISNESRPASLAVWHACVTYLLATCLSI